jgi:phage antirepressor YoqD-like protein
MNEISTEKTMTVREVSEALGCSERVVQKHSSAMGITRNGIETHLNDAQVTAIKLRIEKSGRNDLAHVCELPKINTELEMLLMQKKVDEWKDNRILQLQNQLNVAIPKVEFYNAVTDSTDAIDIGEAAKVLNLEFGRNKLFEFLREQGILMHDNIPYQKYIDAGYFRVIESRYTIPTGETKISLKTVVYQIGLDYIRKLVS